MKTLQDNTLDTNPVSQDIPHAHMSFINATVDSGDVNTLNYSIEGKLVFITYKFSGISTPGGDNTIQIYFPNYIPLPIKEARGTVQVYDNTGSAWVVGIGQAVDISGQTAIYISKEGGANFAASTNGSYMYGSVIYAWK